MANLPNIGKPAANALESIGITQLEELAMLDEKNLLKLHGVGSKAAEILKEALKGASLTFKQHEDLPYSPKFLVFGTLGCNNAPKREIIRDFIIASFMNSKTAAASLTAEGFNTHITLPEARIISLEIFSIITHGKEGAVNGVCITVDEEKHHWAHFIEFENHKKDSRIKNVTSYVK